ncbi:hypothetical protein PRK78_005046 [Emydomyces testavorans]|uniref:EXPERA domain-containing protein n=1 Tax=Emydomyces testavorans TaxID=2070801 RepID=A0AAF0DL06_9EURO|nr:hypothetical protein PRK78_005046 [Emydomyces testavorans]
MAISKRGESKPAKSSCRNRLDTAYIAFFALHLVIMFVLDLVPLYPESIKPVALEKLRQLYIDKYQDKFFTEPPGWFRAYIVMEAVYHVPASIAIIRGLLNDDAFVPVHLLVWAVQSFITTLTCLVEVWDWTDRTREQKYNISLLYGPYVALGK